MKRLLLAVASILIGFQSLAATLPLGPGSIFPIGPSVTGSGGAIYYVANGGSDTNNGLSAATAWQTIGKVNGSGLGPNVTVLFNGGQTFSGGLVITRSVSPSNITIASYGAGQATISSGNSAACVSATNVAGVNVSNIICTGGGNATNTTAGISIVNSQAGNTTLAGPTISGNTVSGYGYNGIYVDGNNGTSGFTGINITNNTVHDITGNSLTVHGSAGILVQSFPADYTGAAFPAHFNVTITGNTVYNATGTTGGTNWLGSGIFVAEVNIATIANNVVHDFGQNNNAVGAGPIGIWAADSNNINIEYNEAYNGFSFTTDGDGFDLDGGTINSVMQYNWSHDNAGWGFLLANYTNSPSLPFANNTVRFNLSQNNGYLGTGAYGEMGIYNQANFTGPVYIYNNTFANFRPGIGTALAGVVSQTGTVTATIANNIFIGAGGNLVYIPTPSTINLYGNDYYTYGQTLDISWNGTTYTSLASWQTATGQEKISGSNVGLTSNPSIYVPGGGFTNGANGYVPANLMAYNLQSGSAMVGAGINLQSQFSINPGTADFYGVAISNSSMPVGAANGDFPTFASSCASATSYLARVSSFSKANNVNYNSLLCGFNSDGNLSLTDALYILAAPNSSASLLNLVSTSYSLTSHGVTTFTANTGIAGDGSTGYLDTGYVPSTAAGNLTLTSGYAAAYNLTSRAGHAGYALFGTNDLADNEEISAYPRGTTNHFFSDLNDNNGITFTSVTNSQGLWAIARSGGTLTSYQNGVQVATGSVAAVALPPVSMFLLAQNNGGSAESWTADQLSAFVIGGGLNQAAASRRLNSFNQANSKNVF